MSTYDVHLVSHTNQEVLLENKTLIVYYQPIA
jgi:hypothetical protein